MTRKSSFVIIATIYFLAFAAAYAMLTFDIPLHALIKMALADLLATLIVFIASYVFRNSSIYDPYWSLFPLFVVIYWLINSGLSGNVIRNFIVTVLVFFWGIRLTLNWARGWRGMSHQDWRYSRLEAEHGRLYWLISFSGVHLFPTICVFLGLIPVYYIFQDDSGIGIKDMLAAGITLAAIVIETVSDEQLRRFSKSSGEIMTSGLWSWSRHPNYFGEIAFWTGLYLFLKDPLMAENYWKISGVVVMIFLFNVISIPMMEKRQIEKKGYHEYRESTSRLLLIPRQKRKDINQ